MLTWAKDPQQKIRAASALIRNERNIELLRKAIHTLHESGQRNFANVTVFADAVEGWAVWGDDAPLEISITHDADDVGATVEPDAFHPLAEYGFAANFAIKRPKSKLPQSILLSVAGNVFHSIRTAGNEGEPKVRVHRPQPTATRDRSVTVIVPVYGDYEATRLCLETLLKELKSSHHRAIIVDDATPDSRIEKYLATLRAKHVEVLINDRNLGFIGSVNRALGQIKLGDVILLNSDTIVPEGFIDRLTAAAQSSPDIGTVTPLTNNGEFTSFPIPNRANPLCSREDIEKIDAIAARFNSDRVIDIPSGIGFCLYVTRACLDSVGPLSEDFDSGYLEDVDFCLRARERGFRNVCAPSVYVGHAGSKSFGEEKRSLVVRNISVLEQRFPKHGSECAAFLIADPLKTARQAIERAAAAVACRPRLLVTGAGTIGTIARQRARDLASEPNPVMILEVQNRIDGASIKIFNAAGGMPQSLQFGVASSSERDSPLDFLQSMEPTRIEILDPANIPFGLVDLLLLLDVPYDIFIADAGLLGPHSKPFSAAAVQALSGEDDEQAAPVSAETETKRWIDRWQKIADGAQNILAPCPQAEAFAAGVLPQRTIEKIERTPEKRSRPTRKIAKAAARHLGLVPVRRCAQEQWLMSEIARGLSQMRPPISVTIIGATLDDIDLMRRSSAFVTGAVSAEEFEAEAAALGLEYLFVSATQPLFGHPILSAAHSSPLPTAYFDWSGGHIKPQKKDLPIDPGSSLDDIIAALDRWIP
jgi:GT2 family glycosyltransferase